MHKRIKHLIKNIKHVFDIDEIDKIAKETKFVQRKSNIRWDTEIRVKTGSIFHEYIDITGFHVLLF